MLNEDEVRVKTEIWDRENKEFMEERERKRRAREQEESVRKRRKSTRKRVTVPGATPLESAQNMLATRRLSKKINYEVLGKLLDNESTQTQTGPAYSGMVPSGAPSRMLSIAGTPMHRSGYASPTQETLVNGTQLSTITELPAALASVAADKGEAAETIVYEEEHHDLQSPTVAAAAAAAASDGSDEEDEEEYSDNEDHLDHAITYEEDPDDAFGYGM
ncbi:hypothetical protein IWW36_004492 [Coemansia brasiliensis]|uniref:Brf1 TBP-binding domain-containing protein n=1 Tax=Coemansia brasiliensis TaxID=2650707 RepID=A0A9W8I3C9_9FUNG|nr:hypothetical protein IWW36_004492 [Coemansia brasiliensis]